MTPIEHIKDANSLEGDAYIYLFEIQLYPSGVMYLCADRTITYLSKEYNLWGIRLTGVASSSDDETARPKLSLANFTYDSEGEPVRGVLSSLQAQNAIEGATVIRRKVLRQNVENNLDIKEEKRWKVSRIASENPDLVVLELRNTLDGPRFTIPARKYSPPEFKQVKLY